MKEIKFRQFFTGKLTILLLFAVVLSGAFSIVAEEAVAQQLEFTVEFSKSDLTFYKLMDYDAVNLNDGQCTTELGKPRLPAKEIRVALPAGMAVHSLRVVSTKTKELSGVYNIFPAQPPIKIGEDQDNLEFIKPDSKTYHSDKVYPSTVANLIGQADLAGQGIAIVEISPLQYIPTEGKLILHTSITFTLEGTDGYVCGDYLPDGISEKGRDIYDKVLKGMVINRDDVAPTVSTYSSMKDAMLPPGGPFDHVIITTSSDEPYYADLVEWHNKKGVRDTVITTSYIYSNYGGADNQEKIRNFVIDAHDNWGTLYFLIGGEHNDVPFKYRVYESESIPSDEYYADFDDDWQVEVFVGRVTADNSTQITRFVNKVIKYETDPERTNYILDATLLGMDLTTAFEPPYYTLTAGEELKESINVDHVPSRFNVTKIYDSYSGNHKTDFLDALNDGQNLINHCDHSNYYLMGTGDRNHGSYIYISDVDYLSNTGRMSVIYSLGCHANEMDQNDCISEHFVIYNDLKAGVAFTGNTRSGWFYVGDPASLSGQLDNYWWRGLFDENKYKLGETLAYTKNNCPHSDIWKYCQWTLNLLGEPEMPIWTDLPDSFEVTYPSLLPVGNSLFTVHVKEFGSCDAYQAYVCLYKDGEVYETGFTDINGNITFTASPESTGDMFVTVTMQNFIPYQGITEVTTDNLSPICQAPGDTTVFLCELSEICIPVGCYDPNGNLKEGPSLLEGPGEIIDGNWCYMPSGQELVSVTILCEDSLGLSCQSTFDVSIDVNDTPTCVPPADTTIIQCSPSQVILSLSISDPDANLDGCEVISGPGTALHGNWVYTPPEGNDTADVTVRCTDECGEFSDASFQVIFGINAAPVCVTPTDTTIVQCSPEPVSLPVSSYDPDGATPSCEIVSGPGSLVGDNWEYSPTGDETVAVTIRCSDTCDAYCDNVFEVVFDTNDPPVCTADNDTTILLCSLGEVSLPVPVDDPDNNITNITITGGPGSIVDGNWVYTPSKDNDTVDVTFRCTDACDEYCDGGYHVIFELNAAPVCDEVNDTRVVMTSPELIIIPFTASDEDDNLSGCIVTEGPGEIIDGHWEYLPAASETVDVAIRCADECDVYCESDFRVTISIFTCGDVDGNTVVDIDDIVYLIAYIFSGGPMPDPLEAGDVNCSGDVDIDDLKRFAHAYGSIKGEDPNYDPACDFYPDLDVDGSDLAIFAADYGRENCPCPSILLQ